MSTRRSIGSYEPGSFTDLSKGPSVVERRPVSHKKPSPTRRFKRTADFIGKRVSEKARELASRGAEVYDVDYVVPIDRACRPVILEYDTSNREGLYKEVSGPWLRQRGYYKSTPLYQRIYVFPQPILGKEEGTHELISGFPGTLPYDHPVRKLGRYSASHLKGQAWEMNLYANTLETKLTPWADAQWQREEPQAFHQQLTALMRVVHPEFPRSPVERATGPLPPFK
jgi:hypothetical protein